MNELAEPAKQVQDRWKTLNLLCINGSQKDSVFYAHWMIT